MIRIAICLALVGVACQAPRQATSPWPAAKSPVVPQADGYVAIASAAISPEKTATYRAIYDATRAAGTPSQIIPALNMAGSELNALGVAEVPLDHAKFVIVVHGPAVDALLDEAHYKAKFGTSNPNLAVFAALKQAGVELYVCGQQLAADGVDRNSLTPDVTIASDALIVLMTYQNRGYALLSF